jgi:hypothetical protein
MSTAETMGDEPAPGDDGATKARAPQASPGIAAGWLLRAAAFTAVGAGAIAAIVAPGLRGLASQAVVDRSELASASLAYFLTLLLVLLVLWGAIELVRAHGLKTVVRVALIAAPGIVVAVSSWGIRERIPAACAVVIAAATTVAAIAGAYTAARAPHTRALAGVLFALAFAAIARLGAWELAAVASERASMQYYDWSRGFATMGVLFEAFAQLLAVTWLWTRSKLVGQVGTALALAGAVVLTWGVARGVHSTAAPWQTMLHTALADAPGLPPPYLDSMAGLATFLVPASLLLALVSAAQPNQVLALVATMALALVSRGSFDAPLRALCAVAAAQWAALACEDERAMWRTLIDDRKRRLADEA